MDATDATPWAEAVSLGAGAPEMIALEADPLMAAEVPVLAEADSSQYEYVTVRVIPLTYSTLSEYPVSTS